MSHYTHFTTEERELSRELKALGYSICQIAARLGRNKSSVSREFKRNSNKDGSYSAHAADDRYKQRRKNCGRKPMLQKDSPMNIPGASTKVSTGHFTRAKRGRGIASLCSTDYD